VFLSQPGGIKVDTGQSATVLQFVYPLPHRGHQRSV
jgi:hypothetical protein